MRLNSRNRSTFWVVLTLSILAGSLGWEVRIPFKAFPPRINEDLIEVESAEERVKQIALQKIETVVSSFKQESPRWVLGVDTLVELNGKAFRKPGSIEEAEQMLRVLSGKVHRVYTGIGLLPCRGEKIDLRSVCTEVKFIGLDDEDIEFLNILLIT